MNKNLIKKSLAVIISTLITLYVVTLPLYAIELYNIVKVQQDKLNSLENTIKYLREDTSDEIDSLYKTIKDLKEKYNNKKK